MDKKKKQKLAQLQKARQRVMSAKMFTVSEQRELQRAKWENLVQSL